MCTHKSGEVWSLKGSGKPPADQAAPLLTAKLYTLGHSARSLEEFEQLLRAYSIRVLADIRRFPRSRRNPQFDDQQLALALPVVGVRYVWMARLGGRRQRQAGARTVRKLDPVQGDARPLPGSSRGGGRPARRPAGSDRPRPAGRWPRASAG